MEESISCRSYLGFKGAYEFMLCACLPSFISFEVKFSQGRDMVTPWKMKHEMEKGKYFI